MNLRDLGPDSDPALEALIRDRIRAGGPLPFSEFMRLALYEPAHGYYVTADPALDYQSSPNLHPVFGAAIGRQLADFWRRLGRPDRFDVFEAGAATGRLAADVLRYLAAAEPQCLAAVRYVVQDETLRGPGAAARLRHVEPGRVEVAAALPEGAALEGCILSNELLDALPFDRVRRRDGQLHELRVGYESGRFVDVEAPLRPELAVHFEALGASPAEGSEGEVCLAAGEWLARAARSLRRGFILTLDYGYEAEALYAPWRRRGTLLTFYRHTSGDDPYVRIGRQDITASVDFTSLCRAGEAAGLVTLEQTTQAELLARLGIGEALATPPAPAEIESYYALRRAVMELTDPSGLGRIGVLIQGREDN